jgi:hypothetical protein
VIATTNLEGGAGMPQAGLTDGYLVFFNCHCALCHPQLLVYFL